MLSIGSSGSILAIGSSGSILAIGAAGGTRSRGAAGGAPPAAQTLDACLAVAGLLAAAHFLCRRLSRSNL
jgi:hypothetical protein